MRTYPLIKSNEEVGNFTYVYRGYTVPNVNSPTLTHIPDEWDAGTIKDPKSGDLIFRLNTGVKKIVAQTDYPIRMGIAIPLNAESVKDPILFAVEDYIDTILTDQKGFLVLSLTGMQDPMFRELMYYTKRDLDFIDIHDDLKKNFKDLNIQMYAKEDPEWKEYTSYINLKDK